MRTAWTVDFEGRGSNYTGNREVSITVRRDAACSASSGGFRSAQAAQWSPNSIARVNARLA